MPTVLQRVWVQVNSRAIGTPACRLRRWDQLLDTTPLRGDNLALPRAQGRRNYDKPADEKPVTLSLQFRGRYAEDGSKNTTPEEAILDYMAELEADLGVGEASVPFEWHRYSLPVLGADIQVIGFKATRFEAPDIANTTLDLLLPPTLTEVGS